MKIATKGQRALIALSLFWAVGWTLFAAIYFEKTCPLGLFAECYTQNVAYAWPAETWRQFWLGLVIPPITVAAASLAIRWIRAGK